MKCFFHMMSLGQGEGGGWRGEGEGLQVEGQPFLRLFCGYIFGAPKFLHT